jgi:ethanolamine utilization protein EutQ (cupin superfamily)
MSGPQPRPAVVKPDVALEPSEPFGPAHITHWTSSSQLDLLGTYAMSFDRTGESEPWTLGYEESILVVRGHAWIVDINGSDEQRFSADPGDLLVLHAGATVRYGGSEGTLLILSIAPVHWEGPPS